MSDVLIVGESSASSVAAQIGELVAAAKAITAGEGSVKAAIAGPTGLTAPEVSVDSVYLVEHDLLGEADSATFDAAVDALSALVSELKPGVVLFGKSDASSVIAPRVAFRSGGVFARDCTAVETQDGSLVVTRPVFGGNANARFKLNGPGPQVIMIRPGSYDADPAGSGAPELVRWDPTPHISDPRSTLIRTVQESHEGVRLEEADVVVSGGRGLGGPEPFVQIEELAGLLDGAVGASRAACDAGWIDHSHQVGLTGKSVSPRLYLTFGISGASQHMAGCSSARNIVAVNTDPDASIFADARFGVVGDWNEVLPALISAVRDIS